MIKQPEAYQKSGYYATNYTIRYDQSQQEYYVFLEDFALRSVTTGLAENKIGAPDKFSLSQNYPNPFNPSTTIRYHLTRAAEVKLTVFNISGQKVKTLVNHNQSAGSFEVEWNGRNEKNDIVSSGVYIYRLKTDSFVQIRKMTLLR